MIITGPAPVKPLIRAVALLVALWAFGWALYMHGLIVVSALHAVGVSS